MTKFGQRTNNYLNTTFPQFGLCVKTYQSDLFNNWINTEWVDGGNGISEITSVAVTNGSFTIDALNLAQKVYNMMNRIAVSGGSYRDWETDRKSTRLNSSHSAKSRMPSSA